MRPAVSQFGSFGAPAFAFCLAACGLTIVGGGSGAAPSDSADGGRSGAGPAPEAEAGPTPQAPEGGGPGDASAGPDADGAAGWRPTPTGSALAFRALSRQYVEFVSIPIPTDFTLEAWVKPISSGSEMMIVSEESLALDTDNQFRLALDAKGSPYFAMTDKSSKSYGLINATTDPTYPVSGPPLALGKWTHVAVTKSGSQFALYLNGSAVTTFASEQGDYSRNRSFDFRIGARMGNGGPDSYFDGLIDDVRFYDVGRSPADVESDWQSEVTGIPADLLDNWRFDEGSGTVATDSAGPWSGTLTPAAEPPTWVPASGF